VAKEIEAEGLPIVQVSALDVLARSVGANRVVRGRAIVNVLGDPALSPREERELRDALVMTALRTLTEPVAGEARAG
jgi:glycine reductase